MMKHILSLIILGVNHTNYIESAQHNFDTEQWYTHTIQHIITHYQKKLYAINQEEKSLLKQKHAIHQNRTITLPATFLHIKKEDQALQHALEALYAHRENLQSFLEHDIEILTALASGAHQANNTELIE